VVDACPACGPGRQLTPIAEVAVTADLVGSGVGAAFDVLDGVIGIFDGLSALTAP
jgi:hypothetical protein